MNQRPQKKLPPVLLKGLTESERRALERASGGDDLGANSADDLMDRAYIKSGLDPVEAAAMRDPRYRMAKAQGPFFVATGSILGSLGLWRFLNAWSNSAISIGGISMFVIGAITLYLGLTGTVLYSDEDDN